MPSPESVPFPFQFFEWFIFYAYGYDMKIDRSTLTTGVVSFPHINHSMKSLKTKNPLKE